MSRSFGVVALGLALVVVGGLAFLSTPMLLAQEATPPGECAETTPEENVDIAIGLLDAALAGDTATMDTLLSEDVTHTVEGVENLPGDEDEIALFLGQSAFYTDYDFVYDDLIAAGDQVVVVLTLNVNEHVIPGAVEGATASVDAVVIVRIACGEIVEIHQVVDTLGILTDLGIIPPMTPDTMGTPAA
jgi:hypothetical protein